MIFQKKQFVDDIQASLPGNTIEQSISERNKNPYWLQVDE